MVCFDCKMLIYKVDFIKVVQICCLIMGVVDGIVEVDGEVIY